VDTTPSGKPYSESAVESMLAQGGALAVLETKMTSDRGDRTAKANAALTARANARAAKVAPIIAEIRATGVTSAYGIALALNGRGIRTATGKRKWEAVQVRRVLARLK
jgi:hypothetical protein